jgi:uncharacterized protein
MYIKIHEAYRTIVALADADIIGQTFEEGIKQIEVRESFFKGNLQTKEELLTILRNLDNEDATFNIVGEKAVATAIEAGIINEEGIMKIDNIPIALGLF